MAIADLLDVLHTSTSHGLADGAMATRSPSIQQRLAARNESSNDEVTAPSNDVTRTDFESCPSVTIPRSRSTSIACTSGLRSTVLCSPCGVIAVTDRSVESQNQKLPLRSTPTFVAFMLRTRSRAARETAGEAERFHATTSRTTATRTVEAIDSAVLPAI